MNQTQAIIGRNRETATLRTAIEQFLAGSPQLVLIEGDAGIGKTQLLRYSRELVNDLAKEEIDWLEGAAPGPNPGRCPDFILWSDDMDRWARKPRQRPSGAWSRLTESYFGETAEAVVVAGLFGLASFIAAGFVDAIPDLLAGFVGVSLSVAVRAGLRWEKRRRQKKAGSSPIAPPLKPEDSIDTSNVNRITLHLSSHFERPAANPVVFALEDLHWADDSSISLIASLLRAAKPSWKILFVVTYRGGSSLPPSAAFASFKGRLMESPYPALKATRIALAPLEDAAGADLVRALLGTTDARLSHWIAQRSGGVPLFIQQFAGLLKEQGLVDASGDLSHPGGLAGLDVDLASGRIPPPDRIEAVLDRRLAGLSEEQRRVLAFLGMDGNPAHEGFLIRAAQEHGGMTSELNGIRRIVSDCIARHGLLRDQGAQGPLGRLFGFEHAFVRDAANRLLVEPERSAVESTRVDWLIDMWRLPNFSDLPQGSRARILDRLVDAIPLSHADAPSGLNLVELYLKAAALQIDVGSVAGARTLLDGLIDALAEGRVHASSLERARVLLSSGQVAIKAGDLPRAMDRLREGIGHALDDNSDDGALVRGWLRFELTRAMRRHGLREDALQEVGKGIQELEGVAADQGRFVHLLGRVRQEKGLTLHDMGRFEEAREVFDAALKTQQRYQELQPGAAATIAQAWILISAIKTERRLGDLQKDLQMSTEVLRLAKGVCTDADDRGQQDLLASANAYYAYSLRKTDLERAEFHQRQARQIRERLTLDEEDLEAQMILAVDLSIYGEILSGLDRLDEALAVRQQSLQIRRDLAERAPGGQNLRLLAIEYGYLSQLLNKLGQREQALEAAREALETELRRETFVAEPERIEKARARLAQLEAAEV